MKFVIPGEPVPQKRHRTTIYKSRTVEFNPCKKEKMDVKKILMRDIHKKKTDLKGKDPEMLDKLVFLPFKDYYHIELIFYFPVPRSDNQTVKKAKLEDSIKHAIKPDLDNLEKFILDACNDILFSDDKKIVKMQSRKLWSENPRTEIEIEGFDHAKGDSQEENVKKVNKKEDI